MKHPLTSLAAAGLALAMITPEPASAQSYQVDCAILLCLVRIPGPSGQRFRKYPATHSDFIRPLIPEYPATL